MISHSQLRLSYNVWNKVPRCFCLLLKQMKGNRIQNPELGVVNCFAQLTFQLCALVINVAVLVADQHVFCEPGLCQVLKE